MIAIIEDEVFASSRAQLLDLLSLFQMGLEGRHRIQTKPLWGHHEGSSLAVWLADRSERGREEIQFALELGLEEEVLEPQDGAICITTVVESDWGASIPCLSLTDALRILRQPLRLLVEDQRNDGAFLEATAPEPWRKELTRLKDRGYLEYQHGGGISRMTPRVRDLAKEPGMRVRHWVLFDSDAREPGKPARASMDLARACQESGVPYRQLRRRAIENYLPVGALFAWATKGKDSNNQRRKKVEAFKEMFDEHRHHFNMKGGFAKDRKQGVPVFFGEFSGHPDLQNGFGEKIGELFHQPDFRFRDEWLEKDGQRDEIVGIVQSIFRNL